MHIIDQMRFAKQFCKACNFAIQKEVVLPQSCSETLNFLSGDFLVTVIYLCRFTFMGKSIASGSSGLWAIKLKNDG
jgi:hypothetical protein